MALGETCCARPPCSTGTSSPWRPRSSIRANPLDGVVLLSGCDKTTPGLLMAASSVDLPAVMVTGGPMLAASTRAPTSARALPCGGSRRSCWPGRMTAEEWCSPRDAWPGRTGTA